MLYCAFIVIVGSGIGEGWGSSGKHHGEVILRCRRWWIFHDRNKRSCWEWQPCTGAMVNLPRQIRKQVQSHRRRVDVALKRATKRARR